MNPGTKKHAKGGVTLNGERIKLSKDKEEAFEEFYRLKVANPSLFTVSLVIVIDEMVEWQRKNHSAGTFRFYNGHAETKAVWAFRARLIESTFPC